MLSTYHVNIFGNNLKGMNGPASSQESDIVISIGGQSWFYVDF